MNRKNNPEDVLSKRTTLRYTLAEYTQVKKRACEAGKSFSGYCREMTINGYVFAAPSPIDLNNVRELKVLLIEQKSHFNRISNLIKNRDPDLFNQIQILVAEIKVVLNNVKI
ncbi:MAG: hypothetical protein JNM71_03965 [Flavobacterium lindanitolerans]|uniref:plasmid mobilization protein n=1 Tax=Flavobacterium lindanitolerans TaxID=428988 RepID=UPI001A454509|nr:hypothetical protein [Flavobacterium lindanitolerans]MBL7867155.1 hypothetical protein [Flavobacterium lindanitolerans]